MAASAAGADAAALSSAAAAASTSAGVTAEKNSAPVGTPPATPPTARWMRSQIQVQRGDRGDAAAPPAVDHGHSTLPAPGTGAGTAAFALTAPAGAATGAAAPALLSASGKHALHARGLQHGVAAPSKNADATGLLPAARARAAAKTALMSMPASSEPSRTAAQQGSSSGSMPPAGMINRSLDRELIMRTSQCPRSVGGAVAPALARNENTPALRLSPSRSYVRGTPLSSKPDVTAI